MNLEGNNNKQKINIQYPIVSSLMFRNILKKSIPSSLLKILELINITLFHYINNEKKNTKNIELKLVYINNIISDILYKNIKIKESSKLKEYVKKSNNLCTKLRKSNYNLTSFENNKSAINPEFINDTNSTIYLKLKFKKKIKEEHNKYKIREMEYLERIDELQSKLNFYEKSIEKLIKENEKLNNKITQNPRKNRTNSANHLSIKDTKKLDYFNFDLCQRYLIIQSYLNIPCIYKIIRYFKDNNTPKNNNNLKKVKVYKFNPLSISSENKYFERLKKDLKDTKISIVDAYIDYSKRKKNKKQNKMRQRFGSLNNLNFKYEVGNSYLRNTFFQLKKDIKTQSNTLRRIKTLLNEIK